MVAFIAARLFKRYQSRAALCRRPSTVLIAIALIGLAVGQGMAVGSASDWAAQQADRVHAVYRIDDKSAAEDVLGLRKARRSADDEQAAIEGQLDQVDDEPAVVEDERAPCPRLSRWRGNGSHGCPLPRERVTLSGAPRAWRCRTRLFSHA